MRNMLESVVLSIRNSCLITIIGKEPNSSGVGEVGLNLERAKWCRAFLAVLEKTQFVQNAKTQFENAKTQFENLKSPSYCKF